MASISILLPDLRGGGVERIRLVLAHEFARQGHSVEFVLMQAYGELLTEAEAVFSVVDLNCPRARNLPRILSHYLRQHRPDALLVAMWPLTIIAPLMRLTGYRGRVVVSEHGILSAQYSTWGRIHRAALRGSMAVSYRLAHGRAGVSVVRQGAAIGLICIAFTAFIDRRPVRFTLWVILAAGFHASALIFLLLLPVATGRYTRSRLILAAILAIPGAFLLATSDAGGVATSRYVDTGREAFGAVFRVGILGLSALYFFWFVRRKWMGSFPQDYSLASIGAIGMVLAFLLLPVSSIISDRFGYYLIPIQVMIFARIPYLPYQVNKSFHAALPYVGLLLFFIVWTQLSWHFQKCYIPYDTWIFGLPGDSILR